MGYETFTRTINPFCGAMIPYLVLYWVSLEGTEGSFDDVIFKYLKSNLQVVD